jgi:hypothetical protein
MHQTFNVKVRNIIFTNQYGDYLLPTFITHLSIFGSKVLLTLKIMDFENVALTKIIHIYVIKCMNA